MKRVVFLLVLLSITVAAYSQHGHHRHGKSQGMGLYYPITLPKEDLNNTEKEMLINARKNEKLAYDYNYTMFSKWGMPVFNHMATKLLANNDALKKMLNKYGLTDPINDMQIGKYSDNELQSKYDSAVAKGNESLKNAYIEAANIEEQMIKFYRDASDKVDNQDLKLLFDNLRVRAEHSFAAFVRNLYRFGYEYQPHYITQAEFNQIVHHGKPGRYPVPPQHR